MKFVQCRDILRDESKTCYFESTGQEDEDVICTMVAHIQEIHPDHFENDSEDEKKRQEDNMRKSLANRVAQTDKTA